MSLRRVSAVLAIWAMAGAASLAQRLIDKSHSDLLEAAPELKGLEFEDNQDSLSGLLSSVGHEHKVMMDKFVNVSLAEAGRAARFNAATLEWAETRGRYRYVLQTNPETELRRPADRYPNAGPYLPLLADFSFEGQKQARFKYLGRMNELGHAARVLVFLSNDESREGLAWIDDATKQIRRIRVNFLKFPADANYETLTKDVRFAAVDFAALDSKLWLPLFAAVHATFRGGEVHGTFRFSEYRIDGYEHDATPEQLKEDTGLPEEPAEVREDPYELLWDGLAALNGGQAAEAVAPLRAAMAGFSPGRIDAAYLLATALQRTGDLAGAEGLMRDVAAKLDPNNEALKANLENALKRQSGVPAGAEPGDRAPTFRTEARQVLVPVVVTDAEGHHVTGLKKSDFKIFEDGVEQTVAAFGSERADLPNAAVNQPHDTAPPPAAGNGDDPKTITGPHAYIICVDGFHTSFNNFAYLSAALKSCLQKRSRGIRNTRLSAWGGPCRPCRIRRRTRRKCWRPWAARRSGKRF